jgi:tRNA threonylcarbamoyladenosine biosynthesis protein TsaE
MFRFAIKNPKAMDRFGQFLGKICEPGDMICLEGDLGAGKTTLTQAIARGCGIGEGEYVSSPTYALFHQYEGPLVIYHMDFYRLGDNNEVIENGLDEYFFQNGLCIVEWYKVAQDLLPDEHLVIEIQISGESSRLVSCEGTGTGWQKRLEDLNKYWRSA